MSYSAVEIAKKLIALAQSDEANGGELLTNLKLQKLLYYQQGYHLAQFGTPLFDEDIEAWMYGPVVPSVYDSYKKQGAAGLTFDGETVMLRPEEEELFNQVFDAFRDFSTIGLMNRTHGEKPWLEAVPHDRGTVISKESMRNFFKTQFE